ncbi:MAG: hypothetical protein U0797_29230 [Gemmataceae bacterium]
MKFLAVGSVVAPPAPQRQEQRLRPGRQHVLAGDHLVVAVAVPVLEVVEDLEGDHAEVLGELVDRPLVVVGRPGFGRSPAYSASSNTGIFRA